MKKTSILALVCFSFALFTSATAWEGPAAISANGELPENGFYIATNSFPVNTVVDVTNMENGLKIRVVVVSGLDSTGLLALLSRDTASIINMQPRSLGRISMSQPAESQSFSPITEPRVLSGDPDYDPALFVARSGYSPALSENMAPVEYAEASNNGRNENGYLIVDIPGDYETPFIRDDADVPERSPYNPDTNAALWDSYTELSLVPAETRPPEFYGANPAFAIPYASQVPQGPVNVPPSDYIDPALIIPPVGASPAPAQPRLVPYLPELTLPNAQYIPIPDYSQFSAPVISNLEKGKYYLQIAAFSKEETVKSELSKLDRTLPIAIMNAGNSEKPLYRILIGPLSPGESGAVLQRFKINYKDAFLRQGP